MISLIAAVDKNFLIGNKNTLPWGRISADMLYFKEKTLGKTVVMGQRTYESLGKPLPNRKNIILSIDNNLQIPGCEIIHSPEDVLKASSPNEELMIIGGAMTYKTFLPYADRLYLTFIDGVFSGDTYFPLTDLSGWKKISETIKEADEKNSHQLTFTIFERVKS